MKHTGVHFRIGVTGHRDIHPENIEFAKQQTKIFLIGLRDLMPNTEISVMSGMADGADRIFAVTALELGMSVQAVLPMPWKYYKSDFDATSKSELKDLFSREDVEVVELSLPENLDENEENWPEGTRDKLYALLSHDLRVRAAALVALWDGDFNHLSGGTGDTLAAYLDISVEADYANIIQLDAEGEIPGNAPFAYWIPISRLSNETLHTTISNNQSCWLFAQGEVIYQTASMPDQLERELSLLDGINRNYTTLSEEDRLISYGNLLDDCRDTLGEDAKKFADTDRAYTMSDSLALYHQTRSDKLFSLFSLMAATMGLMFLVYAKLAAVQALLITYLVLFFGGVYLNARGNKNEWFTRHLVYRCLAETLRVRFYLDLSGAHNKVDIQKILQNTGISNFEGFSWIRYVLKSTINISNPAPVPQGIAAERIECAKKNWIADQAGYFERKSHALHQRHQRLEKIKKWVIAGLVVAAIALVFFKKTLVGINLGGDLSLKTLIIFAMGLFPFWLGVWEIYENKMATKELLWQYQNQWRRFADTEKTLEQASQINHKREEIVRLGETSVIENCLWIIQRYHRDHEPPTAG